MEGDNPALSLFTAVEQNSRQNQEEEEDIEDIRQRQQEIQHFLTAVLDEYNYDESSCDETQKSSLLAYADNKDQLQVLYEMRCKEVRELVEERDNLKKLLEEERIARENSKVFSENLLEQCQISLKQLQEALVDKTEKIQEYESSLKQLKDDFEGKLKEIAKLHDENDILRKDRDELNKKLNEIELKCVTTNKISERELQNQYLDKISLLEKQLKQYEQDIKQLESANVDLKNKAQNVLREKNDLRLEADRTVGDLKRTLDELKKENAFLLKELQETKSDYQKYIDETQAAKRAFEKIKEQIAPSRLQEIDSTVSSLKRLLQEKDEEIAELSKVLHLTQTKSVKDAAVLTETPKKQQEQLKELFAVLQNLKSDFQATKSGFQEIVIKNSKEIKETSEKISGLFKNLNYTVKSRDKFLLELRKAAMKKIEKLQNDNETLSGSLIKVNAHLKKAKNQVEILESRVRRKNEPTKKEICDKETNTDNENSLLKERKSEPTKKEICDKETNTDNENLLLKELELRDRIASDFQQKLKNIEEKYRSASQEKFDHNKLKQQIVELATRLHKYKTLYEESRSSLAEFLTVANEHIKSLESKVLAVERGRHQTQKEMDILKMLVEDKDCKIRELFLMLKRKEDDMVTSRKQHMVEKFKNVATLNEKFDFIAKSADILVREVENEFDKRIKPLQNNPSS